jgi:hypothetical protein
MMLALADGRPAHLTRAHTALLALPEDDQKRLGVVAGWKDRPHQLTCRRVEHTARATGGSEPHMNHLLRVAIRIITYCGVRDVDVVCEALLHGAVEDHAGDRVGGRNAANGLVTTRAGMANR